MKRGFPTTPTPGTAHAQRTRSRTSNNRCLARVQHTTTSVSTAITGVPSLQRIDVTRTEPGPRKCCAQCACSRDALGGIHAPAEQHCLELLDRFAVQARLSGDERPCLQSAVALERPVRGRSVRSPPETPTDMSSIQPAMPDPNRAKASIWGRPPISAPIDAAATNNPAKADTPVQRHRARHDRHVLNREGSEPRDEAHGVDVNRPRRVEDRLSEALN